MTTNGNGRAGRLIARSRAPKAEPTEWQQRRLRLLAWIQATLLGLLVVALGIVLITRQQHDPRPNSYLGMIAVLIAILLAALVLNRAGRFTISALLTVAAALGAPWVSLVIDPAVLSGDLLPLSYVVFSVVLSAMLLGTRVTVAVAAVQWLVLLVLARLASESHFNWVSLLTLVFFTSVICVLGNIVIQRDLRQIHRQARRLATSEAELREQSIRDPLTEVFNRRYLHEALALEIERSRRSGSASSLMIIDIDHFKQLNDTFGHAAGDGVLLQLASLLTSATRASDVVCRYGGDEFVVVLPETPLRVALVRAQRLATQIRDGLVVGGEGRTPVTVSIGLAAYPRHGSSALELMAAADSGLYRAKADGRDCVREAEAVVQQLPLTA